MKRKKRSANNEPRREYDFSGGIRGKHAKQYQQGTNLVLIDADVFDVFPDPTSINRALRSLAEIIRGQAH